MKIDSWPLVGLTVRTPRLELRYPTDELLDELVDVVRAGVHDPAKMPFYVPWTMRPPGELERGFLQYHWGRRAAWEPDDWEISFVVIVDGRPVGMQGIEAKHFPVMREIGTGSWLGRSSQGVGVGREMRTAVLHFAFAGLGAQHARTEAFEDNPASLAVTRHVGYRPDGENWHLRQGKPARDLRFRMSRMDWEARRRDDIEILGLDACLSMFGLNGAGEPAGDGDDEGFTRRMGR
jgi:RimJ/RimL family protein N-acetyltransferase